MQGLLKVEELKQKLLELKPIHGQSISFNLADNETRFLINLVKDEYDRVLDKAKDFVD